MKDRWLLLQFTMQGNGYFNIASHLEYLLTFSETVPQVLPAGTPGPVTATLMFLDKNGKTVTQASIGDEINMVVKSDQAGPGNMMIMDCVANRVGGNGDSVPFKVIDNG